MRAGQRVGERFEVLERVGAGGMGAVYRARDLKTGEPAAVKVVTEQGVGTVERFLREARMLAELSHPCIVRHLAHGTTEDGQPYLAMEWLEGLDLAQRLEREALTVGEALGVVRRAAQALAAAHRAGVIHRDIKPSNLFLVGGDPERVKVLDFGVARPMGGSRAMTRTGAIVGTVGYMSPEQAQNAKDVDGRADIFALGCVLYECVTGQVAYEGNHPVAILAKLLVEEPPRVREVREDAPEAVDGLVARMMAKDRAERPASFEVLLEELEALGAVRGGVPRAPRRGGVVTGTGQRVVSVLLVEPEGPSGDATLTPEHVEGTRASVQAVAGRFGGEATALGSGAVVVILRGTGAATDQASRAAACALAMAKALPEARVALATGRAETAGGTPLGPALEGAAALLSSAEGGEVRIDTVTAALLDPRFEVQEGRLVGERADEGRVRKLLGKPTPCVGRRKELTLLTDTLDECIEEECAQVVVVTAPAGAGKSRLRHELTERLRDRGDGLTVLMARAHPVGAGSALMLVRQLVRAAARLEAEGDPETQYAKVCAYVEGLGVEHPDRTAEFLGEVAGYPKPGEGTPQLLGARNDPRLMAEWMERTVSEWVGAEARRRPLLLALEDLHWGDLATVNYLARALREHPELPWMVLALARPEVDEGFPKLWSDAAPRRMELPALGRRASEQLVRAVLGDDVSAETLGRIVERAGGNAFYLEEFIRHAAEGGADLPDTVLAMVQSRLEGLEPEARRVLQVASVFGETFREAGVEALLGGESAPMDVGGWLEHLVDVEMLEHGHGAGAAAGELAFRHALVRDAAYALIADADKRAAHLAAAEWLEGQPGIDPLVLIEHFEKAGAPERAIDHYLRAAERAYGAGDARAVRDLAVRGREAGAEGDVKGELALVEGLACTALEDWRAALPRLVEGMSTLPHGSAEWLASAGGVVMCGLVLDAPEQAIHAIVGMLAVKDLPNALGLAGQGMATAAGALLSGGQLDMAIELIHRMERATAAPVLDPSFLGWIAWASAHVDLLARDEPAAGLAHFQEAHEHFQDAAFDLGIQGARAGLVWAFVNAGAPRRALSVFDAEEGRDQLVLTRNVMMSYMIEAMLELGERDGVEAMILSLSAGGAQVFAGGWQCYSADARLRAGQFEEAIGLARDGMGVARIDPFRVHAAHVLARSHLALSDPLQALHYAEEFDPTKLAAAPTVRAGLLLTRAEALMALGREDEAREAIRVARDRLLRIHATVPDDLKGGYLTGLRAHRRTMELAHEWLGEA
jgi:eukaryotic-like serine/threonine-protein kinase